MRVGQVSRFSVDETCYTIKFGKTDQSLLTSFAIFKNSSSKIPLASASA